VRPSAGAPHGVVRPAPRNGRDQEPFDPVLRGGKQGVGGGESRGHRCPGTVLQAWCSLRVLNSSTAVAAKASASAQPSCDGPVDGGAQGSRDLLGGAATAALTTADGQSSGACDTILAAGQVVGVGVGVLTPDPTQSQRRCRCPAGEGGPDGAGVGTAVLLTQRWR